MRPQTPQFSVLFSTLSQRIFYQWSYVCNWNFESIDVLVGQSKCGQKTYEKHTSKEYNGRVHYTWRHSLMPHASHPVRNLISSDLVWALCDVFNDQRPPLRAPLDPRACATVASLPSIYFCLWQHSHSHSGTLANRYIDITGPAINSRSSNYNLYKLKFPYLVEWE